MSAMAPTPSSSSSSSMSTAISASSNPNPSSIKTVHRILLDIVSSATNTTPRLGCCIASAALESFKNEATKMVVALVDMERAFVPPQHFIRLVQRSGVCHSSHDDFVQRHLEELDDASGVTTFGGILMSLIETCLRRGALCNILRPNPTWHNSHVELAIRIMMMSFKVVLMSLEISSR
ncbi:uncharacterized protein A4U43_C06F14360 [Asparagus officinalis]|uniref:Uncharacterized protein n=1 Tax=Asparagus officinalis TaxID=4686 RepID=A0A5P1EMH3_ASPOF|nr:uncharacterized protein A4U43_C06F14360 [Asparagus officinalis]